MNNLIVFLTFLVAFVGCANGYVYCYYCANCPNPFTTDPSRVTVVTAQSGFCLKQSRSSDPSYPNSRGAAPPNLCVVSGCRWIYDSAGHPIYNCCCNSNYCNANM